MFYYRFRSPTELSLKEFLYGELFLASPSECNDPFDGASFTSFSNDKVRWTRLFEHCWRQFDFAGKAAFVENVVSTLCSESVLSFPSGRASAGSALIKHGGSLDGGLITHLGDATRAFFDLYEPQRPYLASFTKSPKIPLMWAHYGGMHQGHCLIFRAFGGQLQQDPTRLRRNITRKTSSGIAPSVTWGLPVAFEFEDVHYEDIPSPGDAFSCFPRGVGGDVSDDAARAAIALEGRRRVLTKDVGWNYEQEARVILDAPLPFFFGQPVELTPLERLFYFQPAQLVGVILGAKMSDAMKRRVREIALARKRTLATALSSGGPSLDFVIFQARLSSDDRNVIIEPAEIFSLSDVVANDSPEFAARLASWEAGWGLMHGENGASRMQFT